MQETLVQMFREHCESAPFAPLLRYQDINYSYQHCDQISDLIIAVLQKQGVKRQDVVCIAPRKTLYGYCLILACIKMGVIYCHLDEKNPLARLQEMMQLCQPVLLLCDGDSEQMVKLGELCALPYLSLSEEVLTNDVGLITDEADENDVVYIMFTSGSTGVPKGVEIQHKGLIPFIKWSQQQFAISVDDRLSQVNPLYFDNSVFDFYSAVFSGASLIPVDVHAKGPANTAVKLLAELGCTILFTVPSQIIYWQRLRCFAEIPLPTLRAIIFGGEAFPKSALQPLYAQYHQQIQFTSVYGPTECTCICSAYPINASDFDDLTTYLSLGRLNPGFTATVIADEEDGVGELILFGEGVGRGYCHSPEQTQTRFIESEGSQPRGYRTGDLVTYKNNQYYFAGRIDNQIKHMGYRIELEEIEAVLMSMPDVVQAVVSYETHALVGGTLWAHVQTKHKTTVLALEGWVQSHLPSYMRPHHIIVHQELPKNANGKICRKQLRRFEKLSQ